MVNTYQIVLGTTSMEITPEDVAFNATELIPKDHIAGVFPMTFEQRQVGNTDWTYPYNTITRVTIYLRNGRKLECELQSITNQPTWNLGTLAALQQAIADINPWLQTSFIPPPPPYLIAATSTSQLTTFNINSYTSGGISSTPSPLFKILGDGLVPLSWFVNVDLSSNLEISNDGGATWITSDIIFYTGDHFDTGLVYKVRLKTGLAANTYNETITLNPDIGANVPPYVINVNCIVAVDTNYIQAYGGDFTYTNGDYKYLVFNNSNNLTITQDSLTQTAEIFSIAGGGGGGFSYISHGGAGGGGAGGYLNVNNITVSVGTFPIVVGSGGAAGDGTQPAGYNGSNTAGLGYTSIGGGGGGQGNAGSFYNNDGAAGGSGGGGGAYFSIGGVATIGQGNDGSYTSGFATNGGGGGGGQASIGSLPTGILDGGLGGNGITLNITGSSVTYGIGGQGGTPSTPLAGASNTGNGGTGSYGSQGEQRAGGSGIFVFKFKFQN